MNSDINLVILSYGARNEYLRAIFCIRSFYAHIDRGFQQSPTLLYTDNPDFFRDYLSGLPVSFQLLTRDRITELRGKDDFIHRVKIGIIGDAFRRANGEVLYVDSDTFFTCDPSPIIRKLYGHKSFMHLREYAFKTLSDTPLPSGAPSHAVMNFFHDTRQSGTSSIPENAADLFSWNAGVIGLQKKHESLLDKVYKITDELYAATNNHASEQYAFSLVLQAATELGACNDIVYHYWYRISKRIVDDFLRGRIDSVWLDSDTKTRDELMLRWTNLLPDYLENHPLTLKDNAIQAFNANDFKMGYYWAAKALVKKPFDIKFIRDVAYHTRRYLVKQGMLGLYY